MTRLSSRNKRGTDSGGSTPHRPKTSGACPSPFSSTDDESSVPAVPPSVPPTSTPTNASLSPVASLDSDPSVKLALKEITSLLNTVVKRVERVESELKRSVNTTSSSESSPHGSKKHYVPTVVRVSCIRAWCMILNLCLLLCRAQPLLDDYYLVIMNCVCIHVHDTCMQCTLYV